jgi:hypothetical protein
MCGLILFISNLMLGVETKEISEVSLYMTLFMGWWKHVGPKSYHGKTIWDKKYEVLLGTHWELVEHFGNLIVGGGGITRLQLTYRIHNPYGLRSFTSHLTRLSAR